MVNGKDLGTKTSFRPAHINLNLGKKKGGVLWGLRNWWSPCLSGDISRMQVSER